MNYEMNERMVIIINKVHCFGTIESFTETAAILRTVHYQFREIARS